jgi:hypothetical protein
LCSVFDAYRGTYVNSDEPRFTATLDGPNGQILENEGRYLGHLYLPDSFNGAVFRELSDVSSRYQSPRRHHRFTSIACLRRHFSSFPHVLR